MPKNPSSTSPTSPEDPVATHPDDPHHLLENLEGALRSGDPAVLEALGRQPQFRNPALVEQLLERVESLRPEEPELANALAKLGLRLAARLPNESFARAWDLWSTTCADLGLDGRASAGQMIAGIFDPSLRPSSLAATRGARRRRTTKRRKPRQD